MGDSYFHGKLGFRAAFQVSFCSAQMLRVRLDLASAYLLAIAVATPDQKLLQAPKFQSASLTTALHHWLLFKIAGHLLGYSVCLFVCAQAHSPHFAWVQRVDPCSGRR